MSDPITPKFSGPSGLLAKDFTTKAYLEALYSSDKSFERLFKGWETTREKRRENLAERCLRDGDILRAEGWNPHYNANYGKELTEYLDQFRSSTDYIEDRKYPASATYEDRYGRKYIVEWEYTFHPINHHQVWGKLTMSNQDAHCGEGSGLKPPGLCLTISSYEPGCIAGVAPLHQ